MTLEPIELLACPSCGRDEPYTKMEGTDVEGPRFAQVECCGCLMAGPRIDREDVDCEELEAAMGPDALHNATTDAAFLNVKAAEAWNALPRRGVDTNEG